MNKKMKLNILDTGKQGHLTIHLCTISEGVTNRICPGCHDKLKDGDLVWAVYENGNNLNDISHLDCIEKHLDVSQTIELTYGSKSIEKITDFALAKVLVKILKERNEDKIVAALV